MDFFKLVALILKFNDVTEAVKDPSTGGKPFWTTQRFWGSLVAIIMGTLAYFGIQAAFDPNQVTMDFTRLAEAIATVIPTIYGIILSIKGFIDAKKRKVAILQAKTSEVITADRK